MAANLTPKQENFCLAYLETGNASEAYRRAYNAEKMKPETACRNAKTLLDSSKIAARVAGLKAVAQERALVTVQSITQELEEARALALATETPSAAVAASMGKAKLHGLIVEKSQNDHKSSDGSMTPQAPVYKIVQE